MKRLAFIILALLFTTLAQAQTERSLEGKIDSLVELLQDPDLQAALKNRGQQTTSPEKVGNPGLMAWEAGLRGNIHAVLMAVPRIPSEVSAAAARIRADAVSHGTAPVFLILVGLVTVGLMAEAAYRRWRPGDGVVSTLTSLAVFVGAVFVVFFSVEWPPLARIALLAYLCAFACYRIAAVVIDFASDRRLACRAKLLSAVVLFAIAGTFFARSTGVDAAVTDAVAYLFSILTAALAMEAILSTRRSAAVKAALVAAVVAVWIFWSLDLTTLFWLGVYAFVLPGLLRLVGRVPAGSHAAGRGLRQIFIVRAARGAVIAVAAAWLAFVWRMNPEGLGHQDPVVTAFFYGLLKSVVVLLLADLVWQIAKNWIDRKLGESDSTATVTPEIAARRARFRTLLPILRNALAVVVIVLTALIVLAELGVEIGPLVAGAGIFGVALGFGSQTLVKDVIGGVFYMLDDAFRVGEYIQAKNYKGTVEGFSLRSVRLRHHRGPVFTVPFGELGAVENMSRDWGVVKFRISVSYDTDLEAARKLTKKIGTALMEDPELGPLFIEPLKMKGLEEFGDYGLVLSFGMTLKPVRRRMI